MDSARAAGVALLAVGIGLLLFTFYCAYQEYLAAPTISIPAGSDPWVIFTEVLRYLIEPCIKVMFLGVMGWAGVVLTSRGVQLLRALPPPRVKAPPTVPPPPPTAYPPTETYIPPPETASR